MCIVVHNKNDLVHERTDLDSEYSISVSALKGSGIVDLAELMTNVIRERFLTGGETVAITRQRHKQALKNTLSALDRTVSALNDNMSNEFLALDIREAIAALDDITGHTTSEDVLNNIFDQFCIGK